MMATLTGLHAHCDSPCLRKPSQGRCRSLKGPSTKEICICTIGIGYRYLGQLQMLQTDLNSCLY